MVAGAALAAPEPPPPTLRPATLDDLDALDAIETLCFATDRLSRRSFRHLLTRGNAVTLVEEDAEGLCGYVMVLFHRGTSLARLYSIAVHPRCRGRGLGARLLAAAEQASRERHRAFLRLEVHPDNRGARDLYERAGYRAFDIFPDYYEDDADAIRMEKSLAPGLDPTLVAVPYYEQTLEFTCGPAALLMAMHALDPEIAMDRQAELRLWRESTTIFMTAGHGGCSPYGIALAATRRGFAVEVHVSGVDDPAAFLADTVRGAEKREIVRLVQEDFLAELAELGIAVSDQPLGVEALREAVEAGAVPVVLVSTYRLYRTLEPHWVTVTGFDEDFVYLHDPFVDWEHHKTAMDSMQTPVLQADFGKMIRYGKKRQQAVILLRRRGPG